jgi:hypothetical protein
MEREGSLPHSQQPATCPYPETHQSSPCPLTPSHFMKILADYCTLFVLPHVSAYAPMFRKTAQKVTVHFAKNILCAFYTNVNREYLLVIFTLKTAA